MKFTGFNSSTKVGIGTTDAPEATLHIKLADAGYTPNANADEFIIENGTSGANVGMQIMSPTNGEGRIAFGRSGSSEHGLIAYDHGASSFRIWNNGAERVRIQSDGNVGIGTTAPAAMLEVIARASGGHPPLFLRRGATNESASLKLLTTTTEDWIVGMRNDGTSNFRIYSYGASSDVFSILRSNGNVGIGSATPAQLLHVHKASGDAAAKISCSGHARLILATTGTTDHASVDFGDSGGDTRGRILYLNNGDAMKFETNGAERMRILSDGKVGIGTTAPTARLESWGAAAGSIFKALTLTNDARPSSTLTGTGVKIEFNTADAQEGPSATGFIQAKHTAETFNASAVLQFSAGNTGTVHQTIQSGGNVGIGTTAREEN